jgi:hypothetical protein
LDVALQYNTIQYSTVRIDYITNIITFFIFYIHLLAVLLLQLCWSACGKFHNNQQTCECYKIDSTIYHSAFWFQSMHVNHIVVYFLFFWMEGETVWYLIDIEVVDQFQKEMNQYKKLLLTMLLLWSIQKKEMKTATLNNSSSYNHP